jgi:serine protease AprX
VSSAVVLSICPVVTTTGAASGHDVRLVVQARPGAESVVQAMAERSGATDIVALPLIDGFVANFPVGALVRLRRDRDVLSMDVDRPMSVQGGAVAAGPTVKSDYVNAVRADVAHTRGLTGDGVTVALLDTGVAPVTDLAGRLVDVTDDVTGRVAPCVNFSGETDCGDGYGHGTFLAGIIAGDGAASAGRWTGVAPAARVLSVKVAGRDGSSDVSTVLAAIQWVVSFKDRYGIRVLNLSLGTDSTQSTTQDPLNYAVERAWQSGIVVVVAASNRGPGPRTISKPGDDPWVVTAGAVDDRGTTTVADDRLPDFSSRGPTVADGWAKPDLVAPGAHIVSLRAPGSAIDAQYPSSVAGAYRTGSGTSMSAAVVSGSAALAIQANPAATPDEIKESMRVTSRPAAAQDPMSVGAGELDAYAAATRAPSGTANVGAARSTGYGSLDASRGTVRVTTGGLLPLTLSGLLTAQLLLWDPIGFITGEWTAPTWYLTPSYLHPWQAVYWSGSNWGGSNWGGSNWGGSNWGGSNWGGSNWGGSNWGGSTWYGVPDSTSYGTAWRGAAWYGAWD